MERYGFMAVIPTLTALLLSSFNDFQSFRAQSIIGECTSRHLFSYGGLPPAALAGGFVPKRVCTHRVPT